MNRTVVFEEHGIPVELASAAEIRRAVANGRLRADTLVRTGFEEGDPRIAAAGEIGWLRPLLGLPESALPPLSAPVPAPEPTPQPATTPAGLVQPTGSTAWRPPAPAPTPPAMPTNAGAQVRRSPQPTRVPPAPYHEPDNMLGRGFSPLLRYADFSGRSSPREFWTFTVLQAAGFALLAGLGTATTTVGLAAAALVVPNIAVAVRRCHDQNRSGWLVLIGLIPYVGWLILLVLMMIGGTAGPNRYGADPMGRR